MGEGIFGRGSMWGREYMGEGICINSGGICTIMLITQEVIGRWIF